MREYTDGATAVVRGALAAGCTFFAGYPISPATQILLQMVRDLPGSAALPCRLKTKSPASACASPPPCPASVR